MGSLSNELGIFLVLTKIFVGSSYFLATSILSFYNCFWSIVRTLPNHILLASILADYVGLSCIFSMSGFFWEYIFNLLIVALLLNELFLPSVFPFIFLSGLSEEFDFPPLPNFLLLFLLAVWRNPYFLPIVDYYYINI